MMTVITTAQNWEQANRPSPGEWMNKQGCFRCTTKSRGGDAEAVCSEEGIWGRQGRGNETRAIVAKDLGKGQEETLWGDGKQDQLHHRQGP